VKRNGVRKVVFGLAIASFAGAMAVLGLSFWALSSLGGSHVFTASFFATSFFLGCCGIVLYFMSLPPRPFPPQ
jgi:hypothetical protein